MSRCHSAVPPPHPSFHLLHMSPVLKQTFNSTAAAVRTRLSRPPPSPPPLHNTQVTTLAATTSQRARRERPYDLLFTQQIPTGLDMCESACVIAEKVSRSSSVGVCCTFHLLRMERTPHSCPICALQLLHNFPADQDTKGIGLTLPVVNDISLTSRIHQSDVLHPSIHDPSVQGHREKVGSTLDKSPLHSLHVSCSFCWLLVKVIYLQNVD